MNSISVDNECFYSDHIVTRKPDILTYKELRRVFLKALPHEFRSYKRYIRDLKKADDASSSSSWDKSKKVVRKLRKRSSSLDLENEYIKRYNLAHRFGKALLDLSQHSDNLLVGPLKIIRLPSKRSAPKTIRTQKLLIDNDDDIPSFRGSIRNSNKIKSPMSNVRFSNLRLSLQ